MQKKLIALAVAALASGAAFAQSNVQIYGSIDVGFSHRGDAYGVGGEHASSQNAIDSGISDGNKLGFTGTEALGNGVTALFKVEAGYKADTGAHDVNGGLFARQAFVGLTGGFGTVIAGRLYTPYYSFVSAVDPFADGTVGAYHNVWGSDVDPLGAQVALDPARVDNAVAYVSPSWGGFNITAAYSSNAVGQDNLGNRKSQVQVFALLPRYTNGPVDVALSYHQLKVGDGSGLGTVSAAVDNITNFTLGGTYDFRVVKLAALYAETDVNYEGGLGLKDQTLKNWLIGVTVPFGKSAIQASYNQSKLDKGVLGTLNGLTGNAGKARQYAVGYTYSFSKRTNVYAAYAKNKNDDTNTWLDRAAVTGDASNGNDLTYQNGFQFGLRHTF
ncbi:MAG: porin [Zoogloeaceae bacterium]|jgi:predicted porin|nr:porin [Zoogloeaceae bacterium]